MVSEMSNLTFTPFTLFVFNKNFPLEFRECFYLFARSGQIKSLDELTVIMRSLGLSPTIAELAGYLKNKVGHHMTLIIFYGIVFFFKGGHMSFADFLEVMHVHSRAENLPKEIVDAFRAADNQGRGLISAKHLRHMLQNWGECLSSKEVDRIFREANVTNNSMVHYEDFVKIACAPVPDYY